MARKPNKKLAQEVKKQPGPNPVLHENKQFRNVPDPMLPKSIESELIPITGEILNIEIPKYEYKSILLPREAELNGYGSAGWQLVSVIPQPGDQAVFYFRRVLS